MRHALKKIIWGSILLCWVVGIAGPPSSTKADKSKNNLIEVTLATILDAPLSSGSVLILKENGGERMLPIHIGDPETRAIVLGLQKLRGKAGTLSLERPLTHNLMLNIISKLGAKIEQITVTDLRNETYYADILLKVNGGKELIIDARPSDAIALAVTMDKPVPIYVTKDLMNKAGKTRPELFEGDGGETKRKPLKL